MKHYFKSISCVMLALLACVLTGCKEDPVTPTPTYTVLLGKWVATDGHYFQFESSTTGTFYKPQRDEKDESYHSFTYSFNGETGKITMLFNGKYDAAFYTNGTIVRDGITYTKVSSQTSSLIGKWENIDDYYLAFTTSTQGVYYSPESVGKSEQYENFTYTYNSTTGLISISVGDEVEYATYDGTAIIYGTKVFIRPIENDNNDLLGIQWYNGKDRFYFKTRVYGYMEENGNYYDFSYAYNPETKIGTCYFENKTLGTRTVEYKGSYILYQTKQYTKK